MSYRKSIYIICLLVSFSIGCNKKQDKFKLPVLKIDGVEIADLDPKKLENKTHVKLSQIAENIKIVALQTTNESFLESALFLLGNNYILAQCANEIYQFSSSGEFIRLLARRGRGPEEIPSAGKNISWNINETLDLCFIAVADKIYLYKLSTGKFLGYKRLPGFGDLNEARSITLTTTDSLFIYSYNTKGGVPDDSLECGITVQDWSGNIRLHKKFNYRTWTVVPTMNYELLHGSYASVVSTEDPGEFIFQVDNYDTSYVFKTRDFSLEPYLLIRTQGPLKRGYPVDYISDGSFRIYREFNRINGFQIKRMDLINKYVSPTSIDGYLFHIIYDDNNKTALNIDTFENDYLGFIHSSNGLIKTNSIYPSLAPPYGKILVVYDASQFLKFAREKMNQSDISKEIKDRLMELTKSITELSNPILVIGDMKKAIKIE